MPRPSKVAYRACLASSLTPYVLIAGGIGSHPSGKMPSTPQEYLERWTQPSFQLLFDHAVRPLLTGVSVHSISGGCGWAATLDIMLLFFPVPRSTFLHYLLGTGFSSLVKYHRCGMESPPFQMKALIQVVQ